SMWDAVANELSGTCQVICPDTRGHGRSQIPSEPLSLSELAADAARIIDELADHPVIWVGLSMGGLIGQELAISHPGKIAGLVLANTTSHYAPDARESLGERISAVDAHGLSAVSTNAMSLFFSPAFREQQAATVSRFQRLLEATDPEGYVGCAAALCEADTRNRLSKIRVPTLVIGCDRDESAPRAMLETLTRGIPNARSVMLENCAHLSAVEQPEAFAELVSTFVAGM